MLYIKITSPLFSCQTDLTNYERCDLTVKKSLKIPKEQSESVHRRRTDNTVAKRKSTKAQTTIYKTYI